jgi:STE24 endopeptidase
MNAYLGLIVVLIIGEWLFSLIVEMLNLQNFSAKVPDELADVYDADKYAKSQAYLRETTIFGEVKSVINTVILLAFILFGGFAWVVGIAEGVSASIYLQTIIFTIILMLLSSLLGLPFSIYSTFVIEERYGFNKTTPKTFVLDTLKQLLLGLLITVPIFLGVIWFFENVLLAWLWAWAALVVFQMILVYLSPVLILPLFNKFTPLEDGELKQQIKSYAEGQKYAVQGIYTIDGSKRSSKANAFFTGFGKTKRIALFDTLIGNHSTAELIAVLAHEVGHSKLGHVTKRIVYSFLSTLLLLFIMSFFIHQEGLYAAFGLESTPLYAGIVFFFFIYTPLSMVLGILGNMMSRKHEYEADAFAAKSTGNSAEMIKALKKLSVDSLSNLSPHPLKVFVEYSHPPVLARIKALKKFGT